MGSLLKSAGAANSFRAGNPYNQAQIQNEMDQQNQIFGQQQNLAQALQAQMAGSGPNPAQAQYQQNIGQNMANAQGLIASQRGLNPALAARLGANAVSQAGQQAAGQAAITQAQQQLASQQQLGSLYGQEQQGNIAQQQLYNQANLGAAGINAGVQGQNAGIVGSTIGGLIGAGGGIGAAALMSKGGKIKGKSKVDGDSESNDTVPAMLSPGEIVVPRTKAHDPEKAKEFIDHLLKSKGHDDGDDSGYGGVLEHKRKVAELEKRIKSLEGKKRAS